MSYDSIIEKNYNDLNNLTALLRNYIDMYRILISGAVELNSNSVSKKGDLKDLMGRLESIGDIIDDLLKIVKKYENSYAKYCYIKNELVSVNREKEKIKAELNEELENESIKTLFYKDILKEGFLLNLF